MKTFFLLCITFLCCLGIRAQEGFIQDYTIEAGGISFMNMLLKEDSLMVFGVIKEPDSTRWGLYFAKIDTTGNILHERVHYDPAGRNYFFEQECKIIHTSDGGYAMVGLVFEGQIPTIFKLDSDGEVMYIREYPDTTTWSKRHRNIIEIENGYLSTGVKQQMTDSWWDSFVMRTDDFGNKIWELSYGEEGVWDRLTGITKIYDNEYLITGSTFISSSQVDHYEDMWGKTRAFKIDTTGQITWEWQGSLTYIDGSLELLGQLYPAPDGNWVHPGSYVTVLSEDRLVYQPEIIKRDTNFNILWATQFGLPTSNRNYFANLTPTPDNGYVAVGQYTVLDESYPLDGYRGAMIAKVNQAGDSLWSRVDTLYNPYEINSTPYLSGVVVLPSGSIIACGQVDKTLPEPAFSSAWLIKVDRHGCLEPGCNPLVDGVNLIPLTNLKVFPNPTQDFVQIHAERPFDWELYDARGRRLRTGTAAGIQAQADLRACPAGVYYLRVRQGRAWGVRRVVKN